MLNNYEIVKGQEPFNQPDHVESFFDNYKDSSRNQGNLGNDNLNYQLCLERLYTMRENLSKILNYENV